MSALRKLTPVLERRELKSRLALADLTRCLEQQRASVRALQQLLDAVYARVQVTLAGRFASGACNVAALAELEQHVQALRASAEHIVLLKAQAQHDVEELSARHRAAAHEWRRSESRLGHVTGLARRQRIVNALRSSELDEELHQERRAASAVT